MNRHFLAVVGVVLLMCGCAMKRIPATVVEKLPYEAKIELLESENEVAVAIDLLDDARAKFSLAQGHLRLAKERLSAAKEEVRAAADEPSKEVAGLAVAEAVARVDWLRLQQKLNVFDTTVAEKNLDCAWARHELSKVTAVKKAKLEGSERLDSEAFTAQFQKCEETVSNMKAERKLKDAEVISVQTAWETTKAALAKKTFDARASPFVE